MQLKVLQHCTTPKNWIVNILDNKYHGMYISNVTNILQIRGDCLTFILSLDASLLTSALKFFTKQTYSGTKVTTQTLITLPRFSD